MNAIHRSIRLCGALTVSAVLGVVAGCAQVPPSSGNVRPGQPVARPQASSGCDTGTAAVVGALAGAFFGKGKGHLVGAAVGAGVGAIACTAYNYHARQIRDHAAVEADYRRERGSLPEMNTVSSYRSSLQPSETVRAGSPVALESSIVVVNGTHDQVPKLAETLTLYSPDGKPLSTVTKQATDIGGTGEYQTNFSFNLPKGIQGGRYTVRSSLSMNDKVVKTNEMPMLVVG